MSALVRSLALVGVLFMPAAVSANGLRLRASQTSYYYPATYYYPSYRIICAEPAPAYTVAEPARTLEMTPAPRTFAQPRPAGPSGTSPTPKTTEPPRNPGVSESRPGVTESRSYFSAYAVAPRAADQPSPDRCKVGFWNLSDRDLQLTVGNQSYELPRGKSIRLDLGREFVWRIDNRDVLNEKVPNNDSAVEIVIRR